MDFNCFLIVTFIRIIRDAILQYRLLWFTFRNSDSIDLGYELGICILNIRVILMVDPQGHIWSSINLNILTTGSVFFINIIPCFNSVQLYALLPFLKNVSILWLFHNVLFVKHSLNTYDSLQKTRKSYFNWAVNLDAGPLELIGKGVSVLFYFLLVYSHRLLV